MELMKKESADLSEKMKKEVANLSEKINKAIDEKDGEIVKARSEANQYHKKVVRLEEDFANQEKKLKAVQRAR